MNWKKRDAGTEGAQQAGSGPAASRLHYGFVVLTLIVLSVFGSVGLGRFGYTAILPAMQDSLQLTNTQTGDLQFFNLFGYMITVVIAGMLATRFGPRIVICISLLIAGSGMILSGLVPSFGGVGLGRFLAGVGGAGGNVPAMGLISYWFGSRRRGFATGIAVGGGSLGLIVTGPLVPFILQRYPSDGWRVSWYVLGGIVMVIFMLCALFLRNHPHEKGLVPMGETEAEHQHRSRTPAGSPLQWSRVYKSKDLWHLAAIYFAFGFSLIIYSTFFMKHLISACGFTLPGAGKLWMGMGMASIGSGFIWGSVSDKKGRRFALVCVYALQGLCFLLFGISRRPEVVFLSAALFALTGWSIPALMAALTGDMFGSRLASAALGLITIVFGLRQALGPVVAGRIADAAGSFSITFVLAGVTAWLLGAGGSLLLPANPHHHAMHELEHNGESKPNG